MNPYQPISHQVPSYNQSPSPYRQKSYTLQDSKGPGQVNAENPQLLGQSSLKMINQQMSVLQKDIRQNNVQIRVLNNKIIRSDFENAQLKKLFEKERKLHQKRQQYEQILKNNLFLKQQMLNNKLKESQIKHSLGYEYQSVMESRKRMEKQQKQRQKQEQLAMINMNKQAQVYERQRKRQLFQHQKRSAQQELRVKQQARERERQQKNYQKSQYNQILSQRNQIQTQKDQVYRQYYNHFNQQQEKLQAIYKQKAMQANIKKQKEREEQQKKQYETFQRRMARQNEQKLRKITQERESLRHFLQSQIQESHKKKNRQKQDQLRYQNQVKSYQSNMSTFQMMERQKKRETQKRYDQELAYQIQLKNKMSQQKMQQAYRSSSMGRIDNPNSSQYTERKTHNPVTNPIDFKIGITNPYIIKEYQNTKQKYMGDNSLKLGNLAMIGNNSLMTSRQ